MSIKLQRQFFLSDKTKSSIRRLAREMQKKWHQVKRSEKRFFATFLKWVVVFLPIEETEQKRDISVTTGAPTGRSSLDFATSCDKTKRRWIESLKSQVSVKELSYAIQMSLWSIGKLDAAKVVQDSALGSPSKGRKYKESLESISESTLSPDAAFSIIVEHKLSKSQY